MTILRALCDLVPEWTQDPEVQGVVLVSLTALGAWVMVTWLIQIVFSVLWPFVVVCLVLVFMPHWRKVVTSDVLPRYQQVMNTMTQKLWNTSKKSK